MMLSNKQKENTSLLYQKLSLPKHPSTHNKSVSTRCISVAKSDLKNIPLSQPNTNKVLPAPKPLTVHSTLQSTIWVKATMKTS